MSALLALAGAPVRGAQSPLARATGSVRKLAAEMTAGGHPRGPQAFPLPIA